MCMQISFVWAADLCASTGSLNPPGLTQVSEFQLCTALQERVNADQHFDSKSDHERGKNAPFFVCVAKLPRCMVGAHKPWTIDIFRSAAHIPRQSCNQWAESWRCWAPWAARLHMVMSLKWTHHPAGCTDAQSCHHVWQMLTSPSAVLILAPLPPRAPITTNSCWLIGSKDFDPPFRRSASFYCRLIPGCWRGHKLLAFEAQHLQTPPSLWGLRLASLYFTFNWHFNPL